MLFADSMTFFANLKVALTPAGASHARRADRRVAERVDRAVEVASARDVGESHSAGEAGAPSRSSPGSIAPDGRAGEPGATTARL
jgi:hypothetical protein